MKTLRINRELWDTVDNSLEQYIADHIDPALVKMNHPLKDALWEEISEEEWLEMFDYPEGDPEDQFDFEPISDIVAIPAGPPH